jgi:hypothetical protein
MILKCINIMFFPAKGTLCEDTIRFFLRQTGEFKLLQNMPVAACLYYPNYFMQQ